MLATVETSRRSDALYERVRSVIPPAEWAVFAEDVDAIWRLKRERNAIILAHNYQTPEIFHGVADVRGDSLALAREEAASDNEPTNPIPDLEAGCSLADSIKPEDVRLLRQRYPGVPIVTYVNTSAAVKAESDICCTSGNAKKIVESLGVPQVIMLPDEFLAQNVARETSVKIIAWKGHCEVHERFNAADVAQFREQNPGIVVLAHPECPPDVVAASDFAGSTAHMIDWITTRKPARVVLLTECSMSDNVAASTPTTAFIRPCQLCPHMKRITLKNIRHALETMTNIVTIPDAIAAPARAAVERMITVG